MVEILGHLKWVDETVERWHVDGITYQLKCSLCQSNADVNYFLPFSKMPVIANLDSLALAPWM
jgi:hypothetical protein